MAQLDRWVCLSRQVVILAWTDRFWKEILSFHLKRMMLHFSGIMAIITYQVWVLHPVKLSLISSSEMWLCCVFLSWETWGCGRCFCGRAGNKWRRSGSKEWGEQERRWLDDSPREVKLGRSHRHIYKWLLRSANVAEMSLSLSFPGLFPSLID